MALKNPSPSQLSSFFKQLSSLLRSGLTLNRALKFLGIVPVSSLLEQGDSFSEALSKAGMISRDIKSSIEVAEKNAFLEDALERIALQIDKKIAFKENLKKALAYPSVVLSVSLLSFFGMIFFVLPSYQRLFVDFKFSLPLITRIAMSLPSFGAYILVFLTFLCLIAFYAFKNTDFFIRIPLFGKICKDSIMSDLCYSLSFQLKSGVHLALALNNLVEGLKSDKFKNILRKSLVEIKNGSSLSCAFSSKKFFDKIFIELIAVGEESGKLSDVIFQAGDYFSNRAESTVKSLTAYIEPSATLVVGGFVGFVALSMILPLFSMVNSLL